MVGVIWYRFVRYSGTDWSATLVPIRPLLWYRLERCAGTDSSATVVPIRRYYQIVGILCKLNYHLLVRHIAKMLQHKQACHQADWLGRTAVVCTEEWCKGLLEE